MGVFKITGYDKSGDVVYSHIQENKWTSAMVDKILGNLQSLVFWPTMSLYLSSYTSSVAYTQTSTSLFSSEQNYSIAATTATIGSYYDTTDRSPYSSATMNNSTYPNVLYTNDGCRGFGVGLPYTWDVEAFNVIDVCDNFTTLSVAATAGDTSVTVNDASTFYKGAYISLDDFKHQETQQISNISGNTVTFATALTYSYDPLCNFVGNSLVYYTGITTLTQVVSAGSNILPVASTVGFTPSEVISLYNSSTKLMERAVIGSIETNQFTLTGGVSNAWAQGDSVFGTWASAHSSLADTITRPWGTAYNGWAWSIDDISATNFGSSPIRTIALVTGTTILAVTLLSVSNAIYKDSVSNIKVLRFEYYMYLTAG
jgi:hypothetical protein